MKNKKTIDVADGEDIKKGDFIFIDQDGKARKYNREEIQDESEKDPTLMRAKILDEHVLLERLVMLERQLDKQAHEIVMLKHHMSTEINRTQWIQRLVKKLEEKLGEKLDDAEKD